MNNTLTNFIKKKKQDSNFIALEEGESIRVRLRSMKQVTKTGFNGEEKEVIRYSFDVVNDEGQKITKTFDNGTMRFAEDLVNKKINDGDTFTLSREGLGPKTRYNITDVKHFDITGESTPSEPIEPTEPVQEKATGIVVKTVA